MDPDLLDGDELEHAPGEKDTHAYVATEGRRGGGRGEFLWFVTADGKRDQILPIADIRRMEPPDNTEREVAVIHFSGISVALTGANLRRVLHRIVLHRCSVLYEARAGQRKPPAGEPVIERIEFADLTKATAKPSTGADQKH
ncbi:MAG: hypothetical protein JSR59_03995 [Proteobacteria bacterium]|nr:hypothetical protein [Pseudomonadota bacterium]